MCFLNKPLCYIWHFENTSVLALFCTIQVFQRKLLNQFAKKAPKCPLSLKFYCHLQFIPENCNNMRGKGFSLNSEDKEMSRIGQKWAVDIGKNR